MKRHTCEFVQASDVFKECHHAMEAFAESDPPCSWGENNRSLVTPEVIINALKEIDAEDVQDEVDTVLERLKALPTDLYIDLEN